MSSASRAPRSSPTRSLGTSTRRGARFGARSLLVGLLREGVVEQLDGAVVLQDEALTGGHVLRDERIRVDAGIDGLRVQGRGHRAGATRLERVVLVLNETGLVLRVREHDVRARSLRGGAHRLSLQV